MLGAWGLCDKPCPADIDGNGNPTTPNENQTALVRENYRAGINQLTVDPDNPNYMVAELVVPTTVGGWTVYEVGIFDADGDMVAVWLKDREETTLKKIYNEGNRIRLQPANATMDPIYVEPGAGEVDVVGEAVGVYRRI